MKVVNSFLDLSVAMFTRDLYVLQRKKVISFFFFLFGWDIKLENGLVKAEEQRGMETSFQSGS